MMRLLAWWGMKQSISAPSDRVAVQHALGELSHFADGCLVDGTSVLVDEVIAGVDGGVGCGVEAAAGGHVEGVGSGAVYLVDEVDKADFVGCTGFKEHGTGAVAEENAGGAVGVIDDGAHDVCRR